MNCILWCFYGLPIVKKDNLLVLTINAIGLVIELLYLTVYVIYANDRKKRITEKCLNSVLQLQHLEDMVLEGCHGIDDDGLSTLEQSCRSHGLALSDKWH